MSQLGGFKRAAGALALAGCLVLWAVPAAAQTTATASIQATASVVGVTPLTAAGVNDLQFGAVLAGAPATPPVLSANAGRFNVAGEPSAAVSVSFTLPTDLALMGGGVGSIPITFGANDGLLWDPFPTAYTTFDPNVTFLTSLSGTGNLTVGITGTVNPPATATTGNYEGTITLTVSYL